MAGRSSNEELAEEEDMEEEMGMVETSTLLRDFDHIFQEYKDIVSEVYLLRSSCNAETKKREAVETNCNCLKSDNERLRKLCAETLTKFAVQLECRTKRQSLKEELKQANNKLLSIKDEHVKTIELLRQEHQVKITDLEKHVGCCMLQQSANEATINQLQQELASHKTEIDVLTDRLELVTADAEFRYQGEIQDLKDWILVEQKEKNEFHKKLQNAENELMIIKTKQVGQQWESITIGHVETLKQKVMKLRKENESLKRQLVASDSGDP